MPNATDIEERKGAARIADVTAEVKAALEAGTTESKTLSETLAMDLATLLGAVFPDLAATAAERIDAKAGISKRMAAAAKLIDEAYGQSALLTLAGHKSDTARGWAAFLIAAKPDQPVAGWLADIRPLADDPHFGVREWAWLAVRPHLAADLKTAIAALVPWTAEESPNLRRFAVEALRPRGVWCAHITALKNDPEPGRVLLDPLRADPARYVQDSVANWLNDAGKSRPDWVRDICAGWQDGDGGAATAYIVKRALRNLK